MQKKLIAVAIAGLAAVPAFAADTSVTLYGLIDMGASWRGNNYDNATAARTGVDSGQMNGSRLGVRGSEEIMPGLKANFRFEAGIAADIGGSNQGTVSTGQKTTKVCTNAACTTTANAVTTEQTTNQRVWGRASWVGLQGDYAEMRLGRMYTPKFNMYADNIDPFGLGSVAETNNIFTHIVARADNAVYVTTPFFGNVFAVEAMYSTKTSGDEAAANAGDTRLIDIQPKLKFGPATFFVDYTQQNVHNATTKKGSVDAGVAADFKVVKATLAYARVKDETVAKVNGSTRGWDRWNVAGTVPMGNLSLLAQYSYSKDRNSLKEKAEQIGFGGLYSLSKRTTVYSVYSKINTDPSVKSGYEVADATNSGNGYRAGFNLGVRHTF
ncbi:porin [Niveibacterium umoris]|uniref:Putative porin n=1 Tax=Niveibacterium umoris TaxID=1193620 RepID=A0A840BKZ0_9RHOO|nr:porin [Niveibacterium umoris]MBB4012292.1 putative porin [Niveibacterium umoris]